jgi:hypothetical protein
MLNPDQLECRLMPVPRVFPVAVPVAASLLHHAAALEQQPLKNGANPELRFQPGGRVFKIAKHGNVVSV